MQVLQLPPQKPPPAAQAADAASAPAARRALLALLEAVGQLNDTRPHCPVARVVLVFADGTQATVDADPLASPVPAEPIARPALSALQLQILAACR